MSETTIRNEVQLKNKNIAELLQGYEKANEFMTAERIAFLTTLFI